MISYLLNPKLIIRENLSFSGYVFNLIKAFLLAFFCIGISGIFINFVDNSISSLMRIPSILATFRANNGKLKIIYGEQAFFIIAILGPIVEELIFRLHLSLKTDHVSFSIALFVYIIIGGSFIKFELLNIWFYLKIIFSISSFFLMVKIFKNNSLLDQIKQKYFSKYFYVSAILFGLIHISNSEHINFLILPVYLIYVLPQIIMGLILGGVRIKMGLIFSIFLHIIFNTFFFINNN
ncbi:MAG: CPBP family glutamic-type intramembrane protease [Sediminibacterium sp.]|nr:CPBP family glutamic-type intramembrane protease [Sediminibacterium sp.]